MRRAALVIVLSVLAPCLTACSNLRTHAQIASAAGVAIDAVGAAIEREARSDYEHAKALPDPERQVALLRAQYAPVEQSYEAARKAHQLYVGAIVSAHGRGDKTLRGVLAQPLLGAWLALSNAVEQFGIEMPEPPEVLQRLVKGYGQ